MRQKAVVLFGGSSSERKVSVASAQNLVSTLPGCTPWFLTPAGEVYECSAPHLAAHARPFELDYTADGPKLGATLAQALAKVPAAETVFVLGLHGGDGENGTIQRLLEERRMFFTGSSSEASRKAFDKVEAKRIVSAKGLKVAEAEVLPAGADVAAALRAFGKKHPQFVAKPVADGSSVGVHRIDERSPIDKIASEIARANAPYLLERFLKGSELTVGVVDDPGGAVALPVSEVRLETAAAFDYEAKYLGKGCKEITPAEIPDTLAKEAQRCGVLAHQALGCSGYSRTDLIATADGVYFLETNTLPGMTKASFIPQQLAAAGRSMKAFVEQQIAAALGRKPAK